MSRTNTSFLYLALLFILISSATVLFIRSSALTIENIEIITTERIAAAEIEPLTLGVKGQNLLLFDYDQLRQKIKLHPFVDDVQFEKDFPHTLIIKVLERTPAALVTVEGGVIETDEAGIFLRRFETWPTSNLPVITGINIPETAGPGQLIDDSSLQAVLALINQAPSELVPLIAELHINPVGQITMMLMNGVEVRLGHNTAWADKLQALLQLLNDEVYKSIEHEVRYIDFTAAKPVIGRN